MKECPRSKQGICNGGNSAQSSSAAPVKRVAPTGATSGVGGGTNHLYALNNRQEQDNSPNVLTYMI